MGWSGGGVVTPLYVWNSDKIGFPNITATRFDSLNADLCTAIQNCMAKDGQNAATANLSMGGFKLTNVAAGVALTDAANLGQVANSNVIPRSYILNGDFRWWQRHGWTGSIAVSPPAGGSYLADRWYGMRDGVQTGYTFTQRATTANWYARTQIKVQRDAGNASVVPIYLAQSLDPADIRDFLADASLAHGGSTANRYALFTCYVTKGTTISGATITMEILGNATANANPLTTAGWVSLGSNNTNTAGMSTTVPIVSYGGILGTSLATTYNSYSVRVTYTPVGVAGGDDSFTISNARLYLGTQIAPVGIGYNPDPVELWRLFRFCQKGGGAKPDDTPGAGVLGAQTLGVAQSATDIVFPIQFNPPLAVTPAAGKHLFYRGSAAAGAGPVNIYVPGTGWTNLAGTVAYNLTTTGMQASLGTASGLTTNGCYNLDFSWLADGEFY